VTVDVKGLLGKKKKKRGLNGVTRTPDGRSEIEVEKKKTVLEEE